MLTYTEHSWLASFPAGCGAIQVAWCDMGQSHVEAKSLGSQVLGKWLLMTVLMLKVMESISYHLSPRHFN